MLLGGCSDEYWWRVHVLVARARAGGACACWWRVHALLEREAVNSLRVQRKWGP